MINRSVSTLRHKNDCFKHALISSAKVELGIVVMSAGLLYMSDGNLNAECAVRPPSNKMAAMPDDAISNAVFCCDRIFARINDIKNVLSVPPGASKKKTLVQHQRSA